MVAQRALLFGRQMSARFFLSRKSKLCSILAVYIQCCVASLPREATQRDTLLFSSGFISRGTSP